MFFIFGFLIFIFHFSFFSLFFIFLFDFHLSDFRLVTKDINKKNPMERIRFRWQLIGIKSFESIV